MEQKPTDTSNAKSTDSEGVTANKKKSALPIVALLLNVIPFLYFIWNPDVIMLFLISIFPFAGFIAGIVALCSGKKRIGTPGVILSALAIAWPIVFVAVVMLFSYTGSLIFIM